ncbi:SDR family NAD(P)-dependent oxidoreductase, partial [Staphylococcus auricularis]|uniref:SDR family NAD(P)-dependent oxidoreductase n=1 Tax=Staphylococcus auricularis TaxID=29379 RepID=UPI001CD9A3DC
MQQPFNVVINYHQTNHNPQPLLQNLTHTQPIPLQPHLTHPKQLHQLIQQPTQHFPQIHLLINNPLLAFKFHPHKQNPFTHLPSHHYQQQLDPTLKPPFNLTQTLIPQFIQPKPPTIISIPTNLYQNP